MSLDRNDLQGRLDELLPAYGVPGAQLAVLTDGEVHSAASGILNAETGVEATTDSLFQLGSLGKVYTATLAMTLVAAGKLDLDAPIAEVLPDFRVADADVSKRVTARHLLTHTSGIAGDFFADTGRGDDAIERYVELCADLGQDIPLGVTMSYSNAGFVILGRVLEVLAGSTWDVALREHVLAPLGLEHTVSLPEDVLKFRSAYGHMVMGDQVALAPIWGPPRAVAPAGWVISTAEDVIDFARMHLDGGLAANGDRVLSAELAAEMQREQVRVPERWLTGDAWGLGWWLHDWDGRRLCAHDGAAIGQNSYLKIVPDSNVAIVLLANGGRTDELARELFTELLRETCGIEYLALPQPVADAPPTDERVLGAYERHGVRLEISLRDGVLHGSDSLIEPLASQLPPQDPSLTVLAPSSAGPDVYVSSPEDGEGQSWPLVFFEVEGARYVHSGARALRKVS